VSYTPDEAGMRNFLNSRQMERVVKTVADIIKESAVARAPVGDPILDEHPGRYRRSFKVETHRHGGATLDRAEAIVSNTAPEAQYVEFGHRGKEPYHTLLRAATEVRI